MKRSKLRSTRITYLCSFRCSSRRFVGSLGPRRVFAEHHVAPQTIPSTCVIGITRTLLVALRGRDLNRSIRLHVTAPAVLALNNGKSRSLVVALVPAKAVRLIYAASFILCQHHRVRKNRGRARYLLPLPEPVLMLAQYVMGIEAPIATFTRASRVTRVNKDPVG